MMCALWQHQAIPTSTSLIGAMTADFREVFGRICPADRDAEARAHENRSTVARDTAKTYANGSSLLHFRSGGIADMAGLDPVANDPKSNPAAPATGDGRESSDKSRRAAERAALSICWPTFRCFLNENLHSAA